jgi:hypothetical protein
VALAVCVAGIASAAPPTVVRAGTLVLKVNGGVAPKRLPKRRSAPITLRVSGDIGTVDGSHPPAARRIVTEFDRQGGINARGLAVCPRGRLEARTTTRARVACRRAIVGTGSTTVRVAFAESRPFFSSGPLVLFNGGVRRGVTTLYIHAYVNVPAPTAIVTPVKIKRIRKGRFGTRAVATIPRIAGGSGSVTHFELKIRRTFRHRGRKRSYLFARCAKGRFFARASVQFTGGPRVAGKVVRGCKTRR